MAKLKPEDVFTPSAPAVDSRVYTPRLSPETMMKDTLKEKGTQILVFGDSTLGKTSFVLNTLRTQRIEHVRVQCTSGMRWEDISQEFLRKVSEGMPRVKRTSSDSEGGLGFDVFLLKGDIKESRKTEIEVDIPGSKGSVGHIADVLLKRNMVLVVDDFEKIKNQSTKTSIANLAKNLSDTAGPSNLPKVVVIGIADSADELIDADLSMGARLYPIEIPRMEDEEMIDILTKGFNALKIRKKHEELKALCTNMGGFPKYAHALGLEISRAFFEQDGKELDEGVYKRGISKFMHRYSAHAKALYNKATVVRGKPNKEYTFLIKILAEKGARGDFSFEDAMEAINSVVENLDKKRVRVILNRLTQKQRGPIFHRSKKTGKYRYHNPLSPISILLGECL